MFSRFLTAAAVVIAVSQPIFAQAPVENELYPLKVGNEWVFKSGPVELIEKVAAIEEINGEPCARIETVYNGKVVAHEHLAVRKDGVYRVAVAGQLVDPPLCFLKFPAQPGTQWAVRSKVKESEIAGRFVLSQTKVQLPAGEYPALMAEGKDFESEGTKLSFSYYFIPRVGKVKQQISAGGKEAVLLLKTFRPAQ
ncbi:MAG: hypothetical protein KDA80_11535 [Planctomycetaceae bacterium]|nr:hypothetical protein [Planctomycetaceae bacterium]